MTIRKLLVANRGEIAIRIFRTCQELGIRTVAVFSEADRNALHAQIADEAVEIGPSEAAHSYLAVDRVMEAALKTGVDAIHPGYGFLSERPELPEACGNNGIVFVGPSAAAMRKIGDKISAKQLAVQVGTPIVPGFFSPGATLEQLEEAAERVGYPVMLKASAGGGGRGMRVVRDRNSLPAEFRFAVQEALNAFGEGSMMLEKLVLRPRHVEVQVAADRHGAVACLFERECSLQRRNQKMLEEAPALSVEGGLVDWGHLREAASKLVSSAGYENLGTVEFIVDPTSGEFYFMEVNARLQVEHPVTEAITGLDLVALQLRIAVGEPLDLPEKLMRGDRAAISGHAIEVRVLAEDPSQGFRPSAGKILAWASQERPGVRIDAGFEAGREIPPYYDSLLAKVIAHAPTRPAAILKMVAALEELHILGVATNIGFALDVLADPQFRRGDVDTAYLPEFIERWSPSPPPEELASILAFRTAGTLGRAERERPSTNPAWNHLDSFRIGRLPVGGQ